MDSVIIFSEKIDIDDSNEVKTVKVFSKAELARTLVSEENIRCLIADIPDLNDEYINFFSSVKKSFPVLECAVLTAETGKMIDGFEIINTSENNYISAVRDFIENSKNRNKRVANRFSWPLSAWFSQNNTDWQDLEIFSLSSGGAYLKTDSIFPNGGDKGKLKINFANFSLESDCEVVDSQSRSSNYPFGFGIKFTSLTKEGILVLNKLINNAVIKILMEPETEPEIPSLGGDELTPDFSFI